MKATRLILGISMLSALVFPMSGQTAVTLTVTPVTWNVIGLDSNKPTTGPKFFPLGARVCSSVATTNVTVTLVFDSANANIDLRPGSLNPITIAAIGAGGCADAFFEVEVNQVPAAYDTTRRYHITATDGSGTASTPTPRELYVEHLVSQNRNGITDMRLNGVSIPAGGQMSLLVGNTYTIALDGFTATQGYNQLESFIHFPNTIFQILGVSTTYSADDNTTNVPNPNDRLYANACRWEDDPTSPNYRSCVGGDFKAGGTVTVTYTVRIVGGGGTGQTLGALFYDFSGSSFHYNSDFSAAARIANILSPASLTIAKAFTPGSTVAGGVSTLTFTIANPTAETIGGVNFTDPLPTSPAAMKVANSPGASTSGCGTPTFAPVADATSLSFANGTIAPNSVCTVSVKVTVPASPTSGTYTNVSNNLFVDALDTGHHATAALSVAATPPGTDLCGVTLALWDFASGFSPTSPAPTSASVTASAAPGIGVNAQATSHDSTINPVAGTVSWGSNGGIAGGATLVTANDEYFEFAVDTTGVSAVSLSFDAEFRSANGPKGLAVYYGTTNARPEAGTQLFSSATALSSQNTWVHFGDFTAASGLNASGPTFFRIYAFNAVNQNPGSDIELDHVRFTGCAAAQQPTIAKAFAPNPIAVNGTSTLTFTLGNPNTAPLHGAAFTDALPSGVQVASSPSASTGCGGSWAPAAAATSLTFTGGTIPASGVCTVTVDVTATTAGPHTNVSGFIASTEGGTNSGPGGSAAATLTALQPPAITKLFIPDPILTNATSTLTFLVTNPNPNHALPAVAFSDTLPTSPAVMTVAPTPNASTAGCGSPAFTPAPGAGAVSFTGGTIAAGATCTVKVDVTAPAAGDYGNASGAVSATIAGVTTVGNAASDTLTVRDANPGIALAKRVAPSPSGPWTTFVSVPPGTDVFYRFTIENIGDVPLSPVGVTDPTVSAAGCAWPASLPVASPSQDPTAVCVVGPVTVLAGDHPNTATAHGTAGGSVKGSLPSSADYLGAVPGFSLLKQIGLSATGPWSSSLSNVATGASLFFKFTLVNTGNVALSQVTVTDPDVSGVSACTFTDPLPVNGATTCVVGPVAASGVLGAHVNTATGHGVNGGTPVDTAPSQATYTVVSSDPDPTIGKTHTGNFTQGQPGTYTITVSNVGLAPTSGPVTVDDTLPTGLVPTGAAGTNWSCSIASPTVSCTNLTVLSPGASYAPITITVNVLGTAASSVTNTATVSGGGDTNTTNNAASDQTTIDPGPDLTIQKSHAGNFLQGQAGATYTVTVKNVGPGPTSGLVTVTETPPAGLTVTAMAGTGWTCTTPTCTRSDALAAGQSYEAIAVTVNVSPTATSGTNTATVNGGGDTNATNNTANDPTTIEVPPVPPDLTIQKSHGGTFVQGQTGTYTLTVRNVGGSPTSGQVTVTETPPAGLTVTSMTGTGWACATPTCARSDALAAGQSYEAITVTVSVSATAPASLTNVATVGGGGETNTANNSASDPTTVNPSPKPDLTIQKSHSGNFVQGQSGGTYTVIVSNLGPGSTSGTVTVTEAPPAGLTVTDLHGTGWTCAVGTLTCTRGDTLPASQSYPSITVTVSVSATAPAGLTNVATVGGGGETNTANNSASDPTTVDTPSPGPDLTIQKSHVGNFRQGQAGAYTLTVRNIGGSPTSGLVTVTETPPDGLTVTAMTGTGWTCGTTTCTRSDALPANQSYAAITVSVNVWATAPLSLVNVAAVSGGGDTSPANNTATDRTSVDVPTGVGPDLGLVKSHAGTLVQGQIGATYTLVVTNAGDAPTTDLVSVVDTLPAGLTATAMAGSGWTCVLATLTCTRSDALPPGASYPPITLTVNVASNASGSLLNSASVSGGGDVTPANNGATDAAAVDPAAPIPTLGGWAFGLLVVLLTVAALRTIAGRARRSAVR
jgi:uncharacterized repeat protein (TIGR01451 family)